jgi:hypothetical protein
MPYPHRWAGLGAIVAKGRHVCGLSAISTEMARFVCHIQRGGKVYVPYSQKWAGLCAISTGGGQVCVPYPQRWRGLGVISTQVGRLGAISTQVGRFGCHIRKRKACLRFECHIHRNGQVCMPYPNRWEGLCAIFTETNRFVSHIHRRWAGLCAISTEVGRFGCHVHTGGQVWVPYSQKEGMFVV